MNPCRNHTRPTIGSWWMLSCMQVDGHSCSIHENYNALDVVSILSIAVKVLSHSCIGLPFCTRRSTFSDRLEVILHQPNNFFSTLRQKKSAPPRESNTTNNSSSGGIYSKFEVQRSYVSFYVNQSSNSASTSDPSLQKTTPKGHSIFECISLVDSFVPQVVKGFWVENSGTHSAYSWVHCLIHTFQVACGDVNMYFTRTSTFISQKMYLWK